MIFEVDPCRLYTVVEAGELLGTGKDFVYEQIRSGRLQVVDLGAYGGRAKLRVPAPCLADFIAVLKELSPVA